MKYSQRFDGRIVIDSLRFNINFFMIEIQHTIFVVVPKYVRRLFQTLRNNAFYVNRAARFHVYVGIADNFDVRNCITTWKKLYIVD